MPYNRAGAMKAIHTLGFDHEELHDIARSMFHVDSLGKLSNYQLSQLLTHLKGEKPGAPIAMPNGATDRQIYKIRKDARAFGMLSRDEETNERLEGFINRQCGKTRLADLSKQDAIKVIDGLKNMIQRCTTSANHE